MSQLFYLSAEQLERIKPFFPLSHGIPRVDDLKVISGIIIFTELAETAGKDRRLMIDAPPLKAHRTAASLIKKGLFPAVSDAQRAV